MAGFCQRCCTSASWAVSQTLHYRKGTNYGNTTIAIFLDVPRGLKTVGHVDALESLLKLGFYGRVLCWIKDFLSTDQISVRTYYNNTRKRTLNHGMPQVSALSSLHFNDIFADLPNILPSSVKTPSYDENIYIWTSGSYLLEINAYLQAGINIMVSYLIQWKINIWRTAVQCCHSHVDVVSQTGIWRFGRAPLM